MRGSTLSSGKIKWFNSKKGYGFITDDETNKDIFLHVSALEESKLKNLKEDQELEFEIKEENNPSNYKEKIKYRDKSNNTPVSGLSISSLKIKKELEQMLIRENRMEVFKKCLSFLDTRVELDQSGFKFDIFEH